ncbi:MAG TPA: class I SAM-dependent methyltransferase [Anaerohalosphaeraceae bacterium]|nr:class I SAM-dependent methyltransferase [Phycisphaerae bacterium]HOK94818.1 class I SAM-dependent methyltransferase [Anaerohalosphaeraceae bacterium]HOL30501.1 class I SAM-dependent methyltransferase [Anaerohalosphaeraceae bacterium]HOM75762.1 class I SAM-dependent methyltransferase [Anaerohalosphaeraceae bacterium]HPC63947.1 class I SAM-dependent methyltransferase [Anaerohalosphaeraceae bacterium]
MHAPDNIEQLNAAGWQWALSSGREQLGNLEANLRFLEKARIVKPGLKIHEAGCGIGTIVDHLRSQGCQASGSDIAANAVAYGKNKYPGIDLAVHSAEELPYEDESFDVVLSFDVMEHLFDVDKHLREIRRVLKKSGCYAFQTPNKYVHAVYDTLRLGNLSWKTYHPSLQTPHKLKARLHRHGFSVQFYKMNPGTLFLAKKLGRFAFLARFISILPFESLPLCLQTNLYVVAKKHENPDAQL